MRNLLRHALPIGVLLAAAVACNAGAPGGGAAAPHASSSGGAPADADAAPTSPFPRDATAQVLADIASKLASCKTPGGPTGPGKVKLVFQPTGVVSAVEVVEGPYQGTATGDCVVERFRQARIPPFDGNPVPANKSFMVHED